MKKSGSMIKTRQVEVQQKMGELTHSVSEGVGSQKLTKAFSLESYSLSRFVKKQNDFFRWQMKSTRVEEFTHPVTEFITGVAFIGILLFANYRIQSNAMTSGDFISFITAIAMLIDPLKKYSAAYMKFSQAIAAGDRIFDFLKQPNEADEGTVSAHQFQRGIEIKNLSFSYDGEVEVLKDVSLKVNKGESRFCWFIRLWKINNNQSSFRSLPNKRWRNFNRSKANSRFKVVGAKVYFLVGKSGYLFI